MIDLKPICIKSKYKAFYLVKNGMAKKAFINNLVTGNVVKLRKQLEKGTVIKYDV